MRNKSRLLAIAAAVLLVAAVAGGTLAWLSDQTPAVVNTFAVPENTPEVKEEFDGSVKSSVTIQNTGNITSYVRVKLVGNWVDGSDNVIPEPEDSTLTGWPVTVADGWFEKDGWYYLFSADTGTGERLRFGSCPNWMSAIVQCFCSVPTGRSRPCRSPRCWITAAAAGR